MPSDATPVGPRRVLMAWSSGKDSTAALAVLRADPTVEVAGLFSTLRAEDGRVTMHGVPRALVEAQARSLGLPLEVLEVPTPCPDAVYAVTMGAFVERARARGVTHVAFGDLFLEDVRAWREERLAGTGLGALFPLWGRPTDALARELTAPLEQGGLEAVVVSVDTSQAPVALAGRPWDRALLAELAAHSAGADPCGENGELHTFVTHGPGFRERVEVVVGAVTVADGFAHADLRPA